MCGVPEWWVLPTYSCLKSNVIDNERLKHLAGKRITVGEEEARTITFNIEYNTFQAKQDKKVTRKILYIVQK